MKFNVGFFPVRCNPPHKAHIMAFQWALSKLDRLVIGIGSCYEVGTSRFPLLAFLREKMIRLSLVHADVDMNKVYFVHNQDFNDWDKWWKHILTSPGFEYCRYIISGNKDVLNWVKSKSEKKLINLGVMNPEKDMPQKFYFPYHATDLRMAIASGDYELFEEIAASGTIELLGHAGGFVGIRQAMKNEGLQIFPGRQAVDLILTCKHQRGGLAVLTGKRKIDDANFPGCIALPGGGIKDYENPIDAAIREMKEETGIVAEVLNPNLEPSHVKVAGILSEMRFVGLFGSSDLTLSGKDGGSSQVFHINLDAEVDQISHLVKAGGDLEDVGFRKVAAVLSEGLAFQQTEMLQKAINMNN